MLWGCTNDFLSEFHTLNNSINFLKSVNAYDTFVAAPSK